MRNMGGTPEPGIKQYDFSTISRPGGRGPHGSGILRARNSEGRDDMDSKELDRNAAAMVAPGKGILAADESTGTIKKRFDKIGLESSFEARRAYRELLFTAPEADKYISGVILYDETIRQQTADGKPFPQLLAARGILPGHQGRCGRQGARRLSGRDRDRRPRRAARAPRRVPRARRAVREVARGHRHRRRRSRLRPASSPMQKRSPVTRPFARRRQSSRSSSPKC